VAEECLEKASDLSGLLLLHSARGSAAGLAALAARARAAGGPAPPPRAEAAGRLNVAFLGQLLLGRLDACVDLLVAAGRIPEAAFFARTYRPSRISEVVQLWRKDLAKINPKAAESLADPGAYANLFPNLDWALQAEALQARQRGAAAPAAEFAAREGRPEEDLIERVKALALHAPHANGDVGAPAGAPLLRARGRRPT